MLFIQTIKVQRLRRNIKRLESDLAFFKSVKPEDNLYADAQQLIPLVDAELRNLSAEFHRLEQCPVPTTKTEGEPTVADLLKARKLAATIGMEPKRLLELVAELNQFGDMPTLEKCLHALVEVSS